MTPRTAALAYRIWAYAAPREWNVTIPELAEALGVSNASVNNILRHKGWGGRVRILASDHRMTPGEAVNASRARSIIRELVGTEGLPE